MYTKVQTEKKPPNIHFVYPGINGDSYTMHFFDIDPKLDLEVYPDDEHKLTAMEAIIAGARRIVEQFESGNELEDHWCGEISLYLCIADDALLRLKGAFEARIED